MNVDDKDIGALLESYKKITVVGLSDNPDRPSYEVAIYLKSKGYDLVAVNPQLPKIDGIPVYASIAEVPLEHRKFVDVFRRSEAIPSVVDEVLAAGGVEVLWLQLGIRHPEAEERAEKAGLKVVSDRCMLIEHKKLR